MVKRQVRQAVRFLAKRLRADGLDVARIILFGSHSRGEATATSDVDLVILSEDFRGKNAFDRAELTIDAEAEATRRFGIPLDIITLTPEEFESGPSLVAQFARSGVSL